VKASPVVTGSDKAARRLWRRLTAFWKSVVFGRCHRLSVWCGSFE
jgi:hypothetical protein